MSEGKSQSVSLEKQHEVVSFFCRHLVALGGTYQAVNDHGHPIDEPRSFCYSGFIMSFRGRWAFVTAGHAIKDLERRLEKREICLHGVVLADVFGAGAKCDVPIPISYQDAPRDYEFDKAEGLDFAIIWLSEHERRLLEANGIKAFAEENWTRQDRVHFSMYRMLGIPEETSQLVADGRAERGGDATGMIQPILLAVEEIAQPEDVQQPRHPWFVAKIDERARIKSIVGMSGGPIFGFAWDEEGRLRYWVVGLQSWWDKKRRIVFGCRVPVFAEIISRKQDDDTHDK